MLCLVQFFKNIKDISKDEVSVTLKEDKLKYYQWNKFFVRTVYNGRLKLKIILIIEDCSK